MFSSFIALAALKKLNLQDKGRVTFGIKEE
jgi:hypothetical protein